eukprot:UN3928
MDEPLEASVAEMHHQRRDIANPGDNFDLDINSFDRNNMPHPSDVMTYTEDTTLEQVREPRRATHVELDAQIHMPKTPNENVRRITMTATVTTMTATPATMTDWSWARTCLRTASTSRTPALRAWVCLSSP